MLVQNYNLKFIISSLNKKRKTAMDKTIVKENKRLFEYTYYHHHYIR